VKYFRQWYTVCTIPNPVVGTYFIQVKTNTKADGSAAPNGGAPTGSRCGSGLNGNFQTTDANMYGWGRQGIYANYPGANTTFYLARVLPGRRADADRQLLRRGRRVPARDVDRPAAARLECRQHLQRLHLHRTARQ